MIYRIEIPGEPVPKGRPRVTRQGIAYTPTRTRQYENLVRLAWRQVYHGAAPIPAGTAVRVQIDCVFAPLASATKAERDLWQNGICTRMARRPDLDNLVKAVLDGLDGVAWQDDGCVQELLARKYRGARPGVVVHVEAIQE
jgi:Holliday junction resolvase RusA-like endonuclease